MAKSISFSLDMSTLYKVSDQGKNTGYSLANFGVNIKIDSAGKLNVSSATSAQSGSAVVLSLVDNLWQISYSDPITSICIIGVEDIIGTGKQPAFFDFNISGSKTLNIRRVGDDIICVLR